MATKEGEVGSRITLDEFQRLPESWKYLYEISRGVLVREPRPGRPHGAAVMLLGHHLTGYALEHGGVVTTETGYVLRSEPLTLRGPDIAFCRHDPTPYGDPGGLVAGAPDLVVEVVSPSNTAAEVQAKVLEYLEAGCVEVWLVHPSSKSVVVHPARGEGRILLASDTLTSPLLPGFELGVSEIFRF